MIDKADANGVRLTGAGGFLPELVKAVLERGLAAELTDHLGYERGIRPGGGRRTRAMAARRRRCRPRSGTSTSPRRGIGRAALTRGWCPRGNAGSAASTT